MPSFAISKFIILLGPLWVPAEFLRLSTGPIKYGKNGGYAYGNVSSSNTTWYPSAHPDGIHGLVDVRLSMGRREPGDSGGPIYTADGLFLGTHTGAGDEDGYGFSHIVFSPYVYLSNSGFSALTS